MSFKKTPYLKEILNNFDVNSNVRQTTLKKGVQVGATMVLECALQYELFHVRGNTVLFVTADQNMAMARMENNILPMIHESGFRDQVTSFDEKNSKKSGINQRFLQVKGGGVLYPIGSRSGNRFRSISAPIILGDEVDAYPRDVNQEGDSFALLLRRASAHWDSRKIYCASTPTAENDSIVHAQYLLGDQRKYNVRCLGCGELTEIFWIKKNKMGDQVSGFFWEEQGEQLVKESVRWRCDCGHDHFEHDKTHLFAEENGAKWIPTATSRVPHHRSYQLPTFYSPAGLIPWSMCVEHFIEAYDHKNKKVLSFDKYRTFHNTILGETFSTVESSITLESASLNKRFANKLGQIPNEFSQKYSGSEILFLTCSVDVHKDNLAVAVFGWASGQRCYLIDYWRFYADKSDPNGCCDSHSKVWKKLADIVERKIYYHKKTGYNILATVIDFGYHESSDAIINFISQYDKGVYACIGRSTTQTGPANSTQIQSYKIANNIDCYKFNTDMYKDRISRSFRFHWDESQSVQPEHSINLPGDLKNIQVNELTAEVRKSKRVGGRLVYQWCRSAARNELLDLFVYANGCVDLITHEYLTHYCGSVVMSGVDFWKKLSEDWNFCGRFHTKSNPDQMVLNI